VAGDEFASPEHDEPEEASALALRAARLPDVRDPLPSEVRDPSFSTVVRGYDRHAVDRYVERVNRLIAELQVSGSPRAAVRHALERVGEQTSGILQRARETAEEIIASAREEAEETTRRAKAEAHDIVTRAERHASGMTSRTAGEVDDLLNQAKSRSEELLDRASHEAERLTADAQQEAKSRIERARDEIASLRELAEARMRALDEDIAAVAEARRAVLSETKALAIRLTQVVADAEAVEPGPAQPYALERELPAGDAAQPADTAPIDAAFEPQGETSEPAARHDP
jgi:DivIVA domain-containing protein